MNGAAVAIADSTLLGFPIVTIKRGTYLYHGSRSLDKNAGLRKNAMFTTDMGYAADYAFKRDLTRDFDEDGLPVWDTSLHRKLFCCTLNKDIQIVSFYGISWSQFCNHLYNADRKLPNSDRWVQEQLVSYLKQKYSSLIQGASLHSAGKESSDEYIFDNAKELVNIHRIID